MNVRLPARTLAVVTVALTLTTGASAQVPAREPSRRTVLTIHWSSEDFPATSVIDGAIRTAFRSAAESRVDYYAEYLETDRFPPEQADAALRDYIHHKFAGRPIDTVIAVSDPALQFVLRYREQLFPQAAIVSSTATVPAYADRAVGAGVTGIAGRRPDLETLQIALRLHPGTRRVYVVAQEPPSSYVDGLRAMFAPLTGRVEIVYVNERTVPALLSAIRAVPADSVILFVRHSQETPGAVLFPRDVAEQVAASAPVPVYASYDSYVGTGVVGGVVRMTPALGERLAGLALRILDGARAADIPFEEVPLEQLFDWRQLQRWRIDSALLPPGASLRYREPGVWELYRWYLVAIAGVVAMQGLMIGALVVQRSRRREVEARNSAILRAAPDLMFLLTRDGVYVDYHATDDARLALPPSQFIGRHMREVLPPDVVVKFEECFRTLRPGAPPALVEYTLNLPAGESAFEARVVPCRETEVLAVVREITERRRAEAALTDSRERYARATAAGGVGVWDWDLETNAIYVDPSLKAMLGYEDREIPDVDAWQRLVHPDDLPLAMEKVQALLSGRTALYEVEHRMCHCDGSERWFLVRGSLVRRGDRPRRVIGTSTDVTDRKKAEHELHRAQADLTRLARLTALGEFAASIAHEVRQPLTAIIANAKACYHFLGRERPDVAEVREALLDVVASGRRADAMIQRNRDLFNHRTIDRVPLDLDSVFKETALLARARLQANRITLTAAASALPLVLGDVVGLQQVLLNLISNSIDAMDGSRTGARRIDLSAHARADGMVEVAVKDTGVGLTAVDRERMFELSYTTKAAGTGVGLSISRAIVEAHGGELSAAENADGGATFSFTVPVAFAPVA